MDKIERTKLGDDVVRKIRRAILLGELHTGEHLAEPVLAETFGTSRGPVRDALQLLVREGFVERQTNGRATVKGINEADISNLYDVRILLEAFSIRTWALKGRPEDLQMLKNCIDKMNASSNSFTAISQLDMEYHEQLVRLVQNNSLLQSWLGLKDVVYAILEITNQGLGRNDEIIRMHSGIFTAMKQGAIEKAVHMLEVHLNKGKVLMCERIIKLKSQLI